MGNFDCEFRELGVNFCDFFTVLIYYVPKQLLSVNVLGCVYFLHRLSKQMQ